MKKPSPPSRMMGTAGIAARKISPEEKFGEQQQTVHEHQFSELETLFKIKGPDSEFREEIVDLLDDTIGFQTILDHAPKRNAVHQELHSLQTSYRRKPCDIKDAIGGLSPEALHRLNIYGLNETTTQRNFPTVIKSAIDHTPKSYGARPVNEHHRFLADQFSKLYVRRTGDKPSLIYRYDSGEVTGAFLECLCILFQMVFSSPPTREGIAQLCKRLFYKLK